MKTYPFKKIEHLIFIAVTGVLLLPAPAHSAAASVASDLRICDSNVLGPVFHLKRSQDKVYVSESCRRDCRRGDCRKCEIEDVGGLSTRVCTVHGVTGELGFQLRFNERGRKRAPLTVIDQPGGPGSVGEPDDTRKVYYQAGIQFTEIIWDHGALLPISRPGVPLPFIPAGMFSKPRPEPWTYKDITARHANVIRWVRRNLAPRRDKLAVTGCSAGAFTTSTAHLFHDLDPILDYAVYNGDPGNWNINYMCSGSPAGTPFRKFTYNGVSYTDDAYYFEFSGLDYVYESRACTDGVYDPRLNEGGIDTDPAANVGIRTPIDFVFAAPGEQCDVDGDGKADLVDLSPFSPLNSGRTCQGPDNVLCDERGKPILDSQGRFQLDPQATCYCSDPKRKNLVSCRSRRQPVIRRSDSRGDYFVVKMGGTVINHSDVQIGPIGQTLATVDLIKSQGNITPAVEFIPANHCGGPTATRVCQKICQRFGIRCQCDAAFNSQLGW